MGASGSFEHIKVTPADEDVVIRVGVPADERDSAVGAAPEPAVVLESVPEPAPEPEPEPKPKPKTESSSEPSPERAAAPAGKRPVRSSSRATAAASNEQTLDDLNGEPMPIAQKIVIIAAIVLIIVAVVYYFVAMR